MSFKIPFEILLLTSSAGALQSSFFGVYLLNFKRGNANANRLLSLLLFAFSLRMAKSVSYYFDSDNQIPRLFENAGFAAHLAITPLLYLYLKASLVSNYRLFSKKDLLHFLPAAAVIVLSPFISSRFWLGMHGYTFSLYLMGAYLPFCFFLLYKHYQSLSPQQRLWYISLAAGVTAVWFAYYANYLLGLISYITAPVVFSFVMYYMSYLGLKQNNIFVQERKYKRSAFTPGEIINCFERLQQLMVSSKPYKDTGLTLPKLAKQLSVLPNFLSQVINEKAGQNFPDYVNQYRVADAQAILKDPGSANQKIASIAVDAGFNTLSAFNAAFKKFTGMTPSEYRKKIGSNG